jgi:dolichol-phosphate mannosyltransferase
MDIRASATAVASAAAPAPEIGIIVPTFNERANLPVLVDRIADALKDCDWEIIFVDDSSPDGTAAAARELGESDRRVRCIRRIGRRGLAGACIEGLLACQARYVAVMDADLQHDETLLAAMLARLRQGDVDLVVASRYLDGRTGEGFSASRTKISHWSTAIAQRLLGVTLSDPMSGFFMIRRASFEEVAPSLSTQGFKILLDIAAAGQGRLRVAEVPYVFRKRLHGESKLDSKIALDFAALLISRVTNDMVSFRFLMFCLVGLTGVGIHMAILQVAVAMGTIRFAVAQAIATLGAITWNFVLNNQLTYSDQRLKGLSFLTGLIRFYIICSIGAVSNVGVASWIYATDPEWWIAGLGGAVMGAVWNYVVSAAFVWRTR